MTAVGRLSARVTACLTDMDVSDVSLAPRCHSLVSPQTDVKDKQEFNDSAEVAFPRDSDVCVRLFCCPSLSRRFRSAAILAPIANEKNARRVALRKRRIIRLTSPASRRI